MWTLGGSVTVVSRIDDVSQSALAPVWALTVFFTAAGGVATAWLLDSSLGALRRALVYQMPQHRSQKSIFDGIEHTRRLRVATYDQPRDGLVAGTHAAMANGWRVPRPQMKPPCMHNVAPGHNMRSWLAKNMMSIT